VSDGVGVDTNIWEYAYVEPRVPDGYLLHREARAFLQQLLVEDGQPIVIGEFQICEVLEVLRKIGASLTVRDELEELLWSERCHIARCSGPMIRDACRLSAAANIHVYDYLVALPLRGLVRVIYTADQHFRHPDFAAIARIENPLSWTMREGRLPERVT